MQDKKKRRLAPYDMAAPGWEAVYTSEESSSPTDTTGDNGNVTKKWCVWQASEDPEDWNDDRKYISNMQEPRGGGNPTGLVIHESLIERAREAGISVREWMDSVPGNDSIEDCGQ